jgi:hypothetical protein
MCKVWEEMEGEGGGSEKEGEGESEKEGEGESEKEGKRESKEGEGGSEKGELGETSLLRNWLGVKMHMDNSEETS